MYITFFESVYVALCLEWFFCGLYSGIFAMYLQCPSKESRTAIRLFYILCLLYVLSIATVVSDSLAFIFRHQPDSGLTLFHNSIVQAIANSSCDFIAQGILTYRCWIVWGKDMRVVIIPSILAVTYIGTWLGAESSVRFVEGQGFSTPWGNILILTGLAASMTVNTLMTGMIVFKILSVDRALGALSITADSENTKLRRVVFIIIESGMALFVIQLVRVVLTSQPWGDGAPPGINMALKSVIGVNQMLNGIAPTIILVRVSMKLSFSDQENCMETTGLGSLRFVGSTSDANTLSLRGVESGISMPQECVEEICFNNNSPSDPNSLLRVGSSSSTTPPQERGKDT